MLITQTKQKDQEFIKNSDFRKILLMRQQFFQEIPESPSIYLESNEIDLVLIFYIR